MLFRQVKNIQKHAVQITFGCKVLEKYSGKILFPPPQKKCLSPTALGIRLVLWKQIYL